MNNQQAYYSVLRVRFEFRKSLNRLSNSGTIYGVIYVEGQPKSYPVATGIRCSREDWDARKAPKLTDSSRVLTEQMVMWERSILSAARTLTDKGEIVTAQELLDERNYANRPMFTLLEVVDKYLVHKKDKIGPDDPTRRQKSQISATTYRAYKPRQKRLVGYLKHLKSPRLSINKVNPQFTQSYFVYLQNQPNTGAAFATKCVKFVTEVCQWATLNGLIQEFQVGGFRGSAETVTPPHNVTPEEVSRIEALVLPNHLARARDMWLLARELCLHFSDCWALKPEYFYTDKKGRVVFEKFRQKQESNRSIKIVALVSERALAIWKKYGQEVPLKRCNVQTNRLVREIGEHAGLERPLSFSHARDSGIFQLVAAGYPDVQIKMAAGWTSTKQLVRYVNHDRILLQEMTLRSPYSPPEEGEGGGSNSNGTSGGPNRNNPFSHIYKAS